MIGEVAQHGYQLVRRSPLLRRLTRLRWIARLKYSAAALLLEDPAYEAWIARRLQIRHSEYRTMAPAGLFSFLTTCWNTPVAYLRTMAESLLCQADEQPFEWVVLDNGSTSKATRRYLDEAIAGHPRVRFLRAPHNLGIVAGMRNCLERATGRYVVPLDSDDYLYPDAISVLASFIARKDSPPLLYSDEDHRLGKKAVLPYFKPEWDPVLLTNSPYVSHLCAIDRQIALELDVYGDEAANGCHDWDTCLRFVAAGYTPTHVDEVLYSWRIHPQSMAGNVHAKHYVDDSQRWVLSRFLETQQHPERYHVERSPLFHDTPDWWIRRRHIDPWPMSLIVVGDGPSSAGTAGVSRCIDDPIRQVAQMAAASGIEGLAALLARLEMQDGLVGLVSNQVAIEGQEWPWHCQMLMELHRDVAMVGGRITDQHGKIVDAGRHFGSGDGCVCPDAGRSSRDPGYFNQLWKPHSVSAVSSQFAMFEVGFLRELLAHCRRWDPPLALLGDWAGAFARRSGRRVVYSPFLSAITTAACDPAVSAADRAIFLDVNRDVMSDAHYHSRWLGSDPRMAFRPRAHATKAA